MPFAQLDNIEFKATLPPLATPYPTLTGTLIIGWGRRPPTTVGRAPSKPAHTTIILNVLSSSIFLRSRCTPAAPMSINLFAVIPKNVKV